MGAREAIAALEFGEAAARAALPSPEQMAFEGEVVASLPAGEDLTSAELRVDYLLEKLSDERDRLVRLAEFTARKVEGVHAYEAEEGGKVERRIAWLESRIRDHLPLDPDSFKRTYGKKSAVFPNGKAGFRVTPATVEVTDQEKTLAFARRVGIAKTKTVESVGKTELMEWIIRNGEDTEDDGFRLVPARDEFYVTPTKGEK